MTPERVAAAVQALPVWNLFIAEHDGCPSQDSLTALVRKWKTEQAELDIGFARLSVVQHTVPVDNSTWLCFVVRVAPKCIDLDTVYFEYTARWGYEETHCDFHCRPVVPRTVYDPI